MSSDRVVGPPAEDVVETVVDGDACLYSPRSQEVLVLNSTASAVWHLADGTRTQADLVADLADAFAVDAAVIVEDVRATLERLEEAGLFAPAP